MSAREEKKRLRAQLLAHRAALSPEERAAMDASITRAVLAQPEYQAARTVFCYVSVAPEPDTRAILADILSSGKTLLVPRCGKNGQMDAVAIQDLCQLISGAYGLPEPPPQLPAADPSTIDLALVPALAAGENGSRLGRGGGYYDRFLAGRGYPAWAICYVNQSVPTEALDAPVDRVFCPQTKEETP